jgi:hypothetical protein|tara:strand:- start:739 stop:1524 length:786 start_codon:yes stop_codon:yes gene_type:complete
VAKKPWRKAIEQVLREADGPLSRTEIAETIVARELRDDVGLTPANTVVSNISTSLKNEGDKSPFVRVGRGEYWLKELFNQTLSSSKDSAEEADQDSQPGLINAFGMFWDRSKVDWGKSQPALLGIEQSGAKPIDFASQVGVYVLYDNYRPIYVGRTTNDRLGRRLREHHTISRFRGRWNRFSWFGICGISSSGKLEKPSLPTDSNSAIVAMEALLIEAMEPVQNRRRGDGFSAVEYLQSDDPDLEAQEVEKKILQRLISKA